MSADALCRVGKVKHMIGSSIAGDAPVCRYREAIGLVQIQHISNGLEAAENMFGSCSKHIGLFVGTKQVAAGRQ